MTLLPNIILLLTLGGAPLPDVYVYVEDDPSVGSQHIVDALETPIEQLYSRHPSEVTREYLSWLQDERHTLFEAAHLHLLRRDQAGIKSYVHLPAWSFSSRDVPEYEFDKGVYCHWPAVCKHLTYLAKIYKFGQQQEDRRAWIMGMNMLTAFKWFKVVSNRTDETYHLYGVDVPVQGRRDDLYLMFEPYPPIDLSRMPYKISRAWEYVDADGRKRHGSDYEEFNVDVEYLHQILDQADFGTGIIVHPRKEESEDDAKNTNNNNQP